MFKFSSGAPFIGTELTGLPVFAGHPASRGNIAGTDASFTARAAGGSPLTYRWQFNGETIPGATTNTYIRTNVQAGDTGSYSLVVSNAFGSITSAPAFLSIATQPSIDIQPQSRTNNGGTLATFNVGASGNGLSYQWRRGGTNLFDGGTVSGTTSDILSINAVAKIDAATYTVVITNAAGSVTSAPVNLTVLFTLPWREPFNFNPGENLAGQVSPSGLNWADVGTNTAGPLVTIQSGNLDVTNHAPSSGNSLRFGGLGKSARLSFPSPFTTGTIYYSFAFKVSDLTGFSSPGVFVAGFNNSTGSQGTQPSVVGTRLYLRSAGGGFNLGVAKSSSITTDWVWDSTVFTANQTIFLVGSYTFTSLGNATDDISKLWINPAASSFGASNAPPATLTATTGADIGANSIASFVLFQRDPLEPAAMVADELRIGTAWDSVTPTPALVRIDSATLLPDGHFQLQGSGDPGHFAISGSSDLASWNEITNLTSLNGTFTFTDPAPVNGGRYYRVRFFP